MFLKRMSPLDIFLATFILMYYGRLSVVLFIPQYAIDYGIPSPYYSLHFAMVSVGCAVSNILSIILLRHVNPKRLFLAIGIVSAIYEVLLYFYPTPEMLLLAGLLIGLAAGSFWSLTFLMVCEIIDEHHISTTLAFSKYNVLITVMGAITPLIAGFIVHYYGYGIWLLSALLFLILSTVVFFFLKDPVYYKTYGKYPIKEDLSIVLEDKRTIITFILVMLLSTLTVNTWASLSRVFFTNVGIRNYWVGLLSIIVSIVTIIIYYVLSKKRFSTRKATATLGIFIFGIELVLITFTSDPLFVFILEGVVGTAGTAMVGFATQSVIKNTFRERTYIGRPIFALGMHISNSIWFAVCGYIIASNGGYNTSGSILGVTVDQFGLRIMMLILAGLVALWIIAMWKYEGKMIQD
jgi:MFS family permease